MKKDPSHNNTNSTIKNIARFSGMGIQMGATIYLGAWAGKWLDEKYPMEKNWFTIGLTLFAVGVSLYNVLQQVNRYNKEEDRKK